ncbi:unnamed protein product [Durusdinium trenchii]|uniref:Uncharacterized protein n=1 Tax=Durusdinium trenchii TaxID=1381693 RepID=A0ABP0SXR4_9DINO
MAGDRGGRLCGLAVACATLSVLTFVGAGVQQPSRNVAVRALFPWQQLPEDYVPPKRPYDPVYDSPVAKRIQEEWFKPKERPLEDYFNEWFIPLFLLAAFSAQKRYQTIHGSFQWFIWNFLVFFSWFVSLNCAVWILPAMSPGTWGVKERRSNRAKARSAARNLLGRLRNFGKEEVY